MLRRNLEVPFLLFTVSLDVMFTLFFFHLYNTPAERSAALLLSH